MGSDAQPSLAALLKAYRLAIGLTQEALAERAGLTREAVSLLERGLRRSPHRDTVGLLVEALRLAPAERQRLLAAAEPRASGARAPLTRPGRPGALPSRLTSFIGREREVAEVRELLRARRLVTLAGTGGIGKTSLALEVAAAHERVADGVVLVELAAIADGELVSRAIAAASGARERPGEPLLTTLGAALGPAQRLLVLDNCEHLLDACAHAVEALLRACPRLSILATSREPLRVGAEVVWRVPALTMPPRDDTPLGELAASEAVRLFVERAGAGRPGFALTAANAAAVAEVCRRLDGIPLAIELAATRTATLGVQQLAERLDRRFRLLTGGSRTALPRHQTLRAAIDWSYDLLDEPERTLFARLSVFAGGWTLEAAEAVVVGERIAAEDVPELLARLVEQSLALAEDQPDGDGRYRLLETLREYAGERLAASGELELVQGRHAAYFVGLAERAWPARTGPKFSEWLQRLDREQDNFRAVFRWVIDRRDAETALRLAPRLSLLWFPLAQVSEGRRWVTQALDLKSAQGPSAARAQALGAAATMASEQGDLAAAVDLYEDGLEIWRTLGDQREIADCLDGLGLVRRRQGDLARAAGLFEECLVINRAFGTPAPICNSLIQLGVVRTYQGAFGEAERLLEEARDTYQGLGDPMGVSNAYSALGLMHEERGEYTHAEALFEESLTLRRAGKHRTAAARALLNVAEVLTLQGKARPAWDRYAESLPVILTQGDALNAARCLEGLALLAATNAAPDLALRLASAGAALRRETLAGEQRALQKQLAAALERVRATLGADTAVRAERAGRTLSPAQAFAEAEAHAAAWSP